MKLFLESYTGFFCVTVCLKFHNESTPTKKAESDLENVEQPWL